MVSTCELLAMVSKKTLWRQRPHKVTWVSTLGGPVLNFSLIYQKYLMYHRWGFETVRTINMGICDEEAWWIHGELYDRETRSWYHIRPVQVRSLLFMWAKGNSS